MTRRSKTTWLMIPLLALWGLHGALVCLGEDGHVDVGGAVQQQQWWTRATDLGVDADSGELYLSGFKFVERCHRRDAPDAGRVADCRLESAGVVTRLVEQDPRDTLSRSATL